ncbi:hypothetical protein OROMI_006619 [Orobanche minor]
MGRAAASAYVEGVKVVGIILKPLAESKITGTTIGDEFRAVNMQDRITHMLNNVDAFITLPGGFGTLKEIFQLGETNKEGVQVMISDQIVPRTDKFKYLGSIIQKEGEFEDDVTHRIKAGWLRWRAATRVLCDKKVPLKLKGKFYRSAIRPAMLYGSECWAMKKSLESKLEVAEMRMLRWSCGRTLLDKIPNGVFRYALEVAPISAKAREGRLRWFRHVRRRQASAPNLCVCNL